VLKIRKSHLLFLILSISALLLINGCKKAECEVNSDCSDRACSTVSCVDKQCKYNSVPNCCGNGIPESLENGKTGNKCTCPDDYGVCEGKGEIEAGVRTKYTEYLKYLCDENQQCVFGVDKEDVRPISLVDEREFSFFKLETTITFNDPFDVNTGNFKFRFVVKDDDEDLVFPIKLTKIILTDGEVLFGEKNLEILLNGVRDTASISVPVSYRLDQLEEERRLSYKLDYEHNIRIKDKRLDNGTYSYKEELRRDEYENKFSEKIFLIKSGE
jgi:hypothetical protein